MRTIDTIVVHCSDSPQGRGDDIEAIRRWHMDPKPEGNGWDRIGYHGVIPESGEFQEGEPDERIAYGVRGHNGHILNVCLIGKRSFTTEQLDTLWDYIQRKRAQYGDHLEVMAHYELDRGKTCPNFDVQQWEERREREELAALDDAPAE